MRAPRDRTETLTTHVAKLAKAWARAAKATQSPRGSTSDKLSALKTASQHLLKAVELLEEHEEDVKRVTRAANAMLKIRDERLAREPRHLRVIRGGKA